MKVKLVLSSVHYWSVYVMEFP